MGTLQPCPCARGEGRQGPELWWESGHPGEGLWAEGSWRGGRNQSPERQRQGAEVNTGRRRESRARTLRRRGRIGLRTACGSSGLHQSPAHRAQLWPFFQMGTEAQRPEVTCQRPPCWPGEWDPGWPGAGGAGTGACWFGQVLAECHWTAGKSSSRVSPEPAHEPHDTDLHLQAVGDPSNLKALDFKVHPDGGLVVMVKGILAKPVGARCQGGCMETVKVWRQQNVPPLGMAKR